MISEIVFQGLMEMKTPHQEAFDPMNQKLLLFLCTEKLSKHMEKNHIFENANHFNDLVSSMQLQLLDLTKAFLENQTQEFQTPLTKMGLGFTYEQRLLTAMLLSQALFGACEIIYPSMYSVIRPFRKVIAVFNIVLLLLFHPFSFSFSAETCSFGNSFESDDPADSCRHQCCTFGENCVAIDSTHFFTDPMSCQFVPKFRQPVENEHWRKDGFVLRGQEWEKVVPFIDGKRFKLDAVNPIYINEFDENNELIKRFRGPGLIPDFPCLYKVDASNAWFLWIIVFLQNASVLAGFNLFRGFG